jgi:hypothetical protein
VSGQKQLSGSSATECLQSKLEIAASEYLQGRLTQGQIANKHQVAYTTFRRYLRKHGIQLTAEQQSHLNAIAARKIAAHRRDRQHVHFCKPGCTCKRHRNRRKRPPGSPIECGRRFCSDCGRWRLLIDFHARRRDEAGNVIDWQTICATCQRLRTRVTQGIRRRGKPYGQRKPKPTPEQVRARARERYQERRKDPEWLASRREYERIYQEAKRRAAGIPRDERRLAKRDICPDFLISAVSFALWLDSRIDDYGGSWDDFAAACEVSPRALYRYRFDGEAQPHVRSDFVDGCLLAEGSTTLQMLYPHLFGDVAELQLQAEEPLLALTG